MSRRASASRLSHRLPTRLLLDGSTASALSARGLDIRSQTPESWNLEFPQRVSDAHAEFFAAGASAVHTNTYGANRLRLAAHGLADRFEAINRAGVALAANTRPAGGLVIGSLGPTTQLPPPEGNADLIELEDIYAEQAMLLADAGVDFLHIESLYHPKEARAAIRGCGYGAPDLAVVASLRCARSRHGYATPIGYTLEQLVQVFAEERVDAVGLSCGMPPLAMTPLVDILAQTVDVPIFIKPTVAPKEGAPLYPREFGTGAIALFATGARAVGGCCGTSASDIEAAREMLARGNDLESLLVSF